MPSKLNAYTFTHVSSVVDEALVQLPSDPDWSSGLYRLLVEEVPQRRRKILLWTENDSPVGLIGFALDDRGTWESVTHWILPGWLGPVVSGRLNTLLQTLPFRTRVAWWRMPFSPPTGGYVRPGKEEPTYALSLAENFEAHWKRTGQLRAVNKARKRCEGLVFQVNAPGAAEWVIKRSDERWRLEANRPSPQQNGRLLVAEQLQRTGQYFALTLQDGDDFVAGDTYLVHRGDLVALYTFRDRQYDSHGVGNRLLDLGCFWAREQGFQTLDIGGGFSYKERWAAVGGSKATFVVSSPTQHLLYQARRQSASIWKRVVNQAARLARRAD